MPSQRDGSADTSQTAVSLQYLLENYCDPTDWEIVVDEYKKREIESRKWKADFIRGILDKYPKRITSPRELRVDHRYSLITYLDEELQKASFYGVNPEGTNDLFVEVMEFYGVNITDVAKERSEAARYIARGAW